MAMLYQKLAFGRLAACCMLTAAAGLLIPSPASAQEELKAATLSNASGTSRAGSFELVSIVGQPGPVGQTQGGGFTLSSGYLYVASPPPAAPTIGHTPLLTHVYNQDIPVQVNITGDLDIEAATLHYRRGGEANFSTRAMTQTETGYQGVIPAEAVTDEGVVYFVTATDTRDRTARTPATGFYSVQIEVPDLASAQPQPGGTTQAAYRIVSVPIDLDEKAPSAVLVDDFGAYDSTQWRFFELLFDQTLAEFPNTSAMLPGKGFWLISKEGGRIIDTGSGQSNPLNEPYSIALHPRWNLIGSPFSFPVPIENVRAESGQALTLRSFTGGWNDPLQNRVQELQPFEGYAVFNDRQTVDALLIDPRPPAQGAASAGKAYATAAHAEPLWAIRIAAQSRTARSAGTIAAVMPGAAAEWDETDLPEPPAIGDYISVYFPHPEWGTLSERFCTDIRPEPAAGEIWDLEVKTNVRDPISLTFQGVADVPEAYQVWLVDEALKVSQDLRANNHYALASLDHTKQLKLIVGRDDFTEQQLEAAGTRPAAYEFTGVFPNPFQTSTTVQYGLPGPERVEIKVYNLLGEEVTTLVRSAEQPEGYHVAVWDGSNGMGQPVASGMYLIHVQAGSFSATRKVVLVR